MSPSIDDNFCTGFMGDIRDIISIVELITVLVLESMHACVGELAGLELTLEESGVSSSSTSGCCIVSAVAPSDPTFCSEIMKLDYLKRVCIIQVINLP